jgi:hypothetical protein
VAIAGDNLNRVCLALDHRQPRHIASHRSLWRGKNLATPDGWFNFTIDCIVIGKTVV